MTRFTTLAIVATVATSPLAAQQHPTPQLDVTVIEQDSAGSSDGIIVPVFALLLVVLALSASSE